LIEVARLHKGDCFGELALLYSPTRTASVKAFSDVEVIVLNKIPFQETIIDLKPKFVQSIF